MKEDDVVYDVCRDDVVSLSRDVLHESDDDQSIRVIDVDIDLV